MLICNCFVIQCGFNIFMYKVSSNTDLVCSVWFLLYVKALYSVCSAPRGVLPDQRVRQPVSDPKPGPGATALRLPDAGGPGGAEGVELPTEPRSPETEGEPAEPGRHQRPTAPARCGL